MMKSHTCGQLRESDAGQQVTLAGWVNRRRDQGGLIFIDLRDRWGITQVLIDRADALEAHDVASAARSEFVVQVVGSVRVRPTGSENADLATGNIEVVVSAMTILTESKTPPFYINQETEIEEVTRMKHRYLDLRRPRMQKNMILRHRAIKYIRDWLDAQEFVEIETPILFKTTPEGARDFLVPSRLQPGKFYALPQSPQQLKQLLMVGGYEKYFQIARCFRDEDLRGQRQLEFTQLDLEMSFVEREDVLQLMEKLMIDLVTNVATDKTILKTPFQRILYKDAMEWYGSDKPDIRFDLRAHDVTDLAGRSAFPVFVSNAAEGKVIKVMRAPKYTSDVSGTRQRQILADLEALARGAGAKGLAWMALPLNEADEVKGPIGKFFTIEQKLELFERIGAEGGDLLLFMSDTREVCWNVTDTLRQHLSQQMGLTDPSVLSFVWILDFPMFLWDEENKRWDPSQHMFTMPMPEDVALLDTDPGAARGSQYDLACNGHEVIGGSIRIHDRELQKKIFPLIGQTMEHAMEQFGHIVEAFEYGVPPHGGCAWGLDRVIALLAGEPNIREVIAFPKTATGSDAMAHAPSEVEPKQLEELFIKVVLPETKKEL